MESERSIHVALVDPEIHWNTGNAGRTCLAVGAQLHLVGRVGFSLDEREVRRAGLDYWPRVKPVTWPDWEGFSEKMTGLGEPFFFSAEGTRPYWDARFPKKVVLVFGCESTGLPDALRDRYRERLLSIPMQDRAVRSLNVSTAVGVVAYEVLRQHRTGQTSHRLLTST